MTMNTGIDAYDFASGQMSSSGVVPREIQGMLLHGSLVRVADSGMALGGWRSDLSSHRAMWSSSATSLSRENLVEAIRAIELTGRGGGHFPTAVKLQAAIDSGPGGMLVVNAAEGEPASAKDSVLWQYRPHLILDGASLIADAIGAREIIIWLHQGSPATQVSIEQAIAERMALGVDRLPVRLLLAPAGYVSGESSAVIAGVRGRPVAPIFIEDPARPWGDGAAILVHNTETVARVGALAHTNVTGYQATSLITIARPIVSGHEYERVVVEVPDSATVADAVRYAQVSDVRAFLLGGFAGTWHGIDEAEDLVLDPHRLRSQGLSLGAGIIIALSGSERVLEEATAIAEYLAQSSVGQCGPCVFGLPALSKSLRRGKFSQAREWMALVEGRGGCRMPDGAVRMVRSALALDHQRTNR